MPEEFAVWKERVDAIERKKREHETAVIEVVPSSSSSSDVAVGAGRDDGALHRPRDDERPSHGARAVAVAVAAAPVYATREEAVDAFKGMLEEHDVSATMKMKDVTDACQKDIRFGALKTAGEKKQALAEYQVTVAILVARLLLHSLTLSSVLRHTLPADEATEVGKGGAEEQGPQAPRRVPADAGGHRDRREDAVA